MFINESCDARIAVGIATTGQNTNVNERFPTEWTFSIFVFFVQVSWRIYRFGTIKLLIMVLGL